nr:cytochrome C peroxidase [Candidatus Aminicenantes bacterium]NIQ13289.1 cytochrome C peroxidase [Candidatus Dadabacteria bacterium]NIQ65862.1 cytochrome C peroxidase [Candidatus Aminicenantes bacterium]NIT21849.1 cytochrome C peroxidase [Candidatus Aminicenantes bacterium]
MKTKFAVCTTIIISLLFLLGAASYALTDAELRAAAPASLKTVPVPVPDNLDQFVRNKALAIVLGKALFWDMQAGSDGQ